jgi:hypothetical protein
MRAKIESYVDDLLQLDPIIFTEKTEYGWRGLTREGDILEVRGENGRAIDIPENIMVHRSGTPIGRRDVRQDITVDLDAYLGSFNAAVEHYRSNRLEEALTAADATLALAYTKRARFNRAFIMLASGRWRDGLDEYWECEQELPFMRPQVHAALNAGFEPWRGESLKGRRLLVIHAHGHGDTIMCLRYVTQLEAMGTEVTLWVPPEMRPLADQFAPTVTKLEDAGNCEMFIPILHLLRMLRVDPRRVDSSPYISVDRPHQRSGPRKVGVAWSVGKTSKDDYPREIPLEDLVSYFAGFEIHSVQIQDVEEAERLGVKTHAFATFRECAELMMEMDTIVSVDTAALHLAGAIGHPRVYGLLSHWSSWRWIAPWYKNVVLCHQQSPGDWDSALAQVGCSREFPKLASA